MKQVRCYKCKEFEKRDEMTPIHLKQKGHTRRIYICGQCLGKIITSHFEKGI